MRHLTPNYINSYWATEHGGIVWSRCHGNDDQPLQPDARCWPLPWIDAAVLVADGEGWREAAAGEKGEVVIRRPYPYMALTVRTLDATEHARECGGRTVWPSLERSPCAPTQVWSSDGYGEPGWSGDLNRWAAYFSQGCYIQGDAAIRHADGSCQ